MFNQPYDMNTPPTTPPPYDFGDSSSSEPEALHIKYCDFAYTNQRGRMTADIRDATAKTFADLLSGPVMDLHVGSGKNKRRWSLHRNLLSYHSTWFKEKVAEGAKERGAKDGSIDLFEDDPRAFELLVKWLYQGKIDDVSDMPLDRKWDYADSCQQLYILCDRIHLPELKNVAIDQFRKGCHEAGLVPGPEEMMPIYERTSSASPFRRLVSQIAARQIMDPHSESDASKYRQCFAANAEFSIDVVNAIKRSAGGQLFPDPTEAQGCFFHEHPFDQQCSDELTPQNG